MRKENEPPPPPVMLMIVFFMYNHLSHIDLKPTFILYTSQITDKPNPDKLGFLKNWSEGKKTGVRKQNMGIDSIALLAKQVVQFLGKVGGTYTAHSFHQSSATALVESGIGVLRLSHAGRWKSLTTAEEYTEHSNFEKQDRVDRLDPTANHTTAVVMKVAVATEVAKRRRSEVDTGGTAVHGNNPVINITGRGGGSSSFLNGGGLSFNGNIY